MSLTQTEFNLHNDSKAICQKTNEWELKEIYL